MDIYRGKSTSSSYFFTVLHHFVVRETIDQIVNLQPPQNAHQVEGKTDLIFCVKTLKNTAFDL